MKTCKARPEGTTYSFNIGIVSFNTISEILTDDPYDWGTGPTGLIFLAALVGSFIGYVNKPGSICTHHDEYVLTHGSMGTGYFGDQIVLRLARRNNGYKEPEMRLWALCFSFVYGGVGYFAYGWCSKEGASWVGIAFGLGAMIAQQVSATSIATTYAMECFEGVSGSRPQASISTDNFRFLESLSWSWQSARLASTSLCRSVFNL